MNDLFDKKRPAKDPSKKARDPRVIAIRGAREHNLKDIDLDIPRDRLVVFTGLSGSGKSSLAFDTIYAEGPAPLCREPVRLRAAISGNDAEAGRRPDRRPVAGHFHRAENHLAQSALDGRHRHRDLRLHAAVVGARRRALFAGDRPADREPDRVADGRPHHGAARGHAALSAGARRARPQRRVPQGARRVHEEGLPAGQSRRRVLRDRRSAGARQEIHPRHRRGGRPPGGAAGYFDAACGFARAGAQARRRAGDRRARRRRAGRRRQGQPAAQSDRRQRIVFSEKFACPVSGFTISEIEPRLFSFNNPFGACPKCGGLGVEQHIDADLVIPDKDRTLRKGAIAPWAKSSSPYYVQTLTALGKHYKFTLDTKWKDLPKKTQDAILHGSGDTEIRFSYDDGMRAYDTKRVFEGVITNLERRFRETDSDWAREEIARYFTDVPCDACKGFRLKPEALCVKIDGKHIGEISDMSVKGAAAWFTELPQRLTSKQNEIAGRVLKEIRERLKFLVDVGLEYLTLARASRHAVRRREPAHPPRLADRLRAHRRALRARRAVDRPAPARQCAASGNAAPAARPRQHRDRGRARRGRHPLRRRSGRHRPRRRHPRRPCHRPGPDRRSDRGARIPGPENICPASWRCKFPSAGPKIRAAR